MTSLRAFLESIPESVFHLDRQLSVIHEITALQYALEAAGHRPVVHVAKPVLPDGSPSDIGVICNLTASRELTARALGIADPMHAARAFAERSASPIPPRVVERTDAPVQELVFEGDAADLTRLPALLQHQGDPGRYLTAAHATTYDPDSGVDNTAIQRCWIKGPRSMSWFPYPASHNYRNLRKFWSRGEPCPVVMWIGHHPAVSVGTQAKLRYPESHWAAAGGLIGEPLRLTPSISFGSRIMVPADAEIVIEGLAPVEQWEPDGPFGEYTGYLGPQTLAPKFEVLCVTRRANALYHDYGSGLADMLVPDNMAMEGKLFGMIRAVAPSLINVHVPVSGRRFHAYLQLKDPQPGEARDALVSALSYRRVKAAFAVDSDIDIFNDSAMLWATATRVQWDRDALVIPALSGSSLDPSWPVGARTAAKIGLDATLPGANEPGVPRPVAPRSSVPAAALEKAHELLAGVDRSLWPQS